MPEDAKVSQFVVREDSSERPTEKKTIPLGDDEVVIEAELAEEALMERIESQDAGEEYVLRRVLAKFETPDFPTETVDGEELLAEDMVEKVATARAERLFEEYIIMNGADRDAIEKAKEEQKEQAMETMFGNSDGENEGNGDMTVQVDAETLADEARRNSE